MAKLTKYSELKPFDIFRWNNSTYVWLNDNFGSILCIEGAPNDTGKFPVYVGGLPKYETVDLIERETEWEVVGQFIRKDL
jgi:hypothetical protein